MIKRENLYYSTSLQQQIRCRYCRHCCHHHQARHYIIVIIILSKPLLLLLLGLFKINKRDEERTSLICTSLSTTNPLSLSSPSLSPSLSNKALYYYYYYYTFQTIIIIILSKLLLLLCPPNHV